MARRTTWIGLAMAIPATVAFSPVDRPGTPPAPPPAQPQVMSTAQPRVAVSYTHPRAHETHS